MTGNPLSGHTAANETSMVGSGVFTDSLEDGEHITSPSLTNMLEGVHGNGILLEEDTATDASNRNTPEDLPGVCEQVTNSYTARVTGGHAILDGVLYKFANGPASTQDIAFTTTSDHKRATYTALTTGQEALIVVYVSTNTAEECITWEMGTPVTTASNIYPTTPSAFLSNPMTSGLDVTQSVVLAVIRVVYSATGGDLKISISESNDKRVFVRPTPMYLTPVTTGVVGNKTAVDSHTALDAVNSDSGNLTTSRMGAIWQSYNSDGDATLYYSAKDSSDNRHTHVLGPVGYVSASPSGTTTFTFNEGQVFVLNPSTAIQFNPTGTFPLGHKVFITNEAAHDTNAVTFDNAGIGIVLKGKEAGVFVYTGSAWKNVMLASGAVSPNGHGANGLVQLSDGAGGFTSDSKLAWTASPASLGVTGEVTATTIVKTGGTSSQFLKADGSVDTSTYITTPPAIEDNSGTPALATGITQAEMTTLLGIEPGATADQTGAEIKAAYETEANAFTDAQFTKLSNIEANATADQTNAEIRAAVEAATDSNVFTDADHTKLNDIEASATADQTAAEIKTAYESNADTNEFSDAEQTKLSNIEANADVTDTTNVVAALTAGTNITIAADGTIATGATTNTGTVTSVATGTGLSGGPITTTGTVALANTAVSAGSYTNADITVDAQGRITAAADGSGGGGAAPAIEDNSGTPAFATGITKAEVLSLLNVEDGADVTDATNVTAAGALMDSEVTNLAQVKAFNSADYATAAQGTKIDGVPTGQYQRFNMVGSTGTISAGTATQLTFGTTGAVLAAQYTPVPTDFVVPAANTHIDIVAAGLYQFTFCGFLAAISSGNPDYRITISSTSSLTGDILSFRNRTQSRGLDRYTGSGVATVYLTAGSTVYFSMRCDVTTYQIGGDIAPTPPATTGEIRTFLDVRRLE